MILLHVVNMWLNQKQKDATSKALLDIGKIVLATFVIGGLIPNSPIKAFHLVAAIVISVILYLASMMLLKGK